MLPFLHQQQQPNSPTKPMHAIVSILNMIRCRIFNNCIQKSLHSICRAQLGCRRLNLHCKGTRKIEEEQKTKTDNIKNKPVNFYFQLQVHAFNGRVLWVYLEMVSKEAKTKAKEEKKL